MKEFSMPLKKLGANYLPIIDYHDIPTLVDTGAVIPVFSIKPSILSNRLKAELISENKAISGFGGKATGDIYSLPKFTIGKMNFRNCEVFVPHKIILENLPIILSASMFYGTHFAFDTINGRFIVKMNDNQPYDRAFKIKEKNGILYPVVNGVLVQTFNYNVQSLLVCDKSGNMLPRNIFHYGNLKKSNKSNSKNKSKYSR